MKDWFYQLSNPRKTKNITYLLTYLFTYLLTINFHLRERVLSFSLDISICYYYLSTLIII